VLSVLTEGGALSGVLTDSRAAPELVKQLEKRIQEVESAEVAIPNEEALTGRRGQ
jgi:hypothetical protein